MYLDSEPLVPIFPSNAFGSWLLDESAWNTIFFCITLFWLKNLYEWLIDPKRKTGSIVWLLVAVLGRALPPS